MLTEDVMELTVETYQEVRIIPGQWALCLFEDETWPFQRAYSIVDQDTDNEKTMIVFAIKLLEQGRAAAVLKKTLIGQEFMISWIFGHFVLQNNDPKIPKVFIWTGVGISPLLNMIKYCTTEKQLLFSVSYKKDLFYENRIKKIHGLKYAIHISRESVPGYVAWRIDLVTYNFAPACEFYVCWGPEVVNAIVEKLSSLGFKKIYTEKF